MTRPVLISLRGTQAYGREAPETIELLTRGTLTGRNGKFAISYEETELTGNQGVTTTFLILNPGRVVLNRTGALQSKMVFVEGVKDESFYDLGFGSLLIGVYAHQIQVDLTENGGRLFIDYSVEIEQSVSSRNSYEITITRDDTSETLVEPFTLGPGHVLDRLTLAEPLPMGDYPCTATVARQDQTDRMEVSLTLHVAYLWAK